MSVGLDVVKAAIVGPEAEVCGGYGVATSAIAIQLWVVLRFKALRSRERKGRSLR